MIVVSSSTRRGRIATRIMMSLVARKKRLTHKHTTSLVIVKMKRMMEVICQSMTCGVQRTKTTREKILMTLEK